MDVFDRYYQSWYPARIVNVWNTFGGKLGDQSSINGMWLQVEWKDAEKEIWRETLARHGGHLRSRTVKLFSFK